MNKFEWQYSKNTIYHLDREYEIAVTSYQYMDIHDPVIKELIFMCEAYLDEDAWSIASLEAYDNYITIRCWNKIGLQELKQDYPELFKEEIND